ncbi:carboxymuconolactone decarboxylase family protein [Methyloversatilis sp. XJ19-13]|uniref:carboxymuconolactone decarboxylase family protein n=1 Tax=Methyloversatilis sp. XJ19-13 TaxID=2963430 RepID=UPI00211CD496|nr:carboxymuconolactone decarboxylase family protein [Methyloversatilis sp. XJ19-13]MCQ9374927.1 carboxymuconolactone decarboxylase family protein [Methyloversatilis sp. XJ19-13]
MSHIPALDPARADSDTASTLAAVRAKLGMLPNLIATLAHAPAALNGYLALSEILASGRLSAHQREIVALAVAQANACQYCLSAHTAIARGAGLKPEQIAAARAGQADSPLDHAIARFARQLVEQRARLAPGDLQTLRRDGLDDGLTVEVIAHAVLNLLTNYVNHVAGTEVDFPPVSI